MLVVHYVWQHRGYYSAAEAQRHQEQVVLILALKRKRKTYAVLAVVRCFAWEMTQAQAPQALLDEKSPLCLADGVESSQPIRVVDLAEASHHSLLVLMRGLADYKVRP